MANDTNKEFSATEVSGILKALEEVKRGNYLTHEEVVNQLKNNEDQ